MDVTPEPALSILLGRIARGDQLALEDFYDRTGAFVFGLARRIFNDIVKAQDVSQEVYLQVWREAGQYSVDRGTPLTWLSILVRTRAIDYLRSNTKHDNHQPLDLDAPIADAGLNAEEKLAANVRRSIVLSALALLSVSQREAIELSFYSGLTHNEIASKLKQPVGTVKSHIRLGMLKLRDRLGPYRGDL